MEQKFDDRKLKVVVSPTIASKLCDLGYAIVKIKPKRDLEADEFMCNTVFLFEQTNEFMKDFLRLTKKRKEQNG